jgi:hypothetical protein
MYASFSALLPFFLNASWKSYSLRVFSTACDATFITSVVSKGSLLVLSSIRETEKRRRGPSQVSRVVGSDSHVLFGQKLPFVAKVSGEVLANFNALTVKHDSSMWNWLFCLLE